MSPLRIIFMGTFMGTPEFAIPTLRASAVKFSVRCRSQVLAPILAGNIW